MGALFWGGDAEELACLSWVSWGASVWAAVVMAGVEAAVVGSVICVGYDDVGSVNIDNEIP